MLRELDSQLEMIQQQKLKFYDPYPKQIAFHKAGKEHPFRLFMAGNQLGKSDCGGAEFAMHLTGLYPDDWDGRVFDHKIVAWVGGDTNNTTRDVIQAKLFGEPGSPGTGFVPRDCIGKIIPSRNISGGIDTVTIKHKLGGYSTLVFKSYQQGRARWQGKGVHLIWCDEEPDIDIWGEACARITATEGMIMLTFTPLSGLSEVVRGFFPHPDSVEKFIVRMEMEEAQHPDGRSHLTPETRKLLLGRYPRHQRDARLKGLPVLGSGLVYPVSDSTILESVCTPGKHWRHIIGLDLGGAESATAWAWMALDPDTDVLHLLHVYSEVDPRISVHAASLLSSARNVNVAWPHDANITQGDGVSYANDYRQRGVRMLPESARFPDNEGGGHGVEAGISKVYNRMAEGRFKVPLHIQSFWDELRTYHRADGKVVKNHDHVMDAVRYGIMMLRFARQIGQNTMPTRVGSIYNPLQPTQEWRSSRFPTRAN